MSIHWPDTQARQAVCTELADINHEFLRLMTHPALRGADAALGLEASILKGLRQLDDAALREVAAVPMLLAEFQPLPGFDEVRDEGCNIRTVIGATLGAPHALTEDWRAELEGFANRLLACIWQTARRDAVLTSLYVGVEMARAETLAKLDFAEISRYARESAGSLRVRLADHPHFWPDLVRLTHSGDARQRIASRLAALPLAAADYWSSSDYTPGYGKRALAGR